MSVIQAALITNPFRKGILHLRLWIKFFCLRAVFEGDSTPKSLKCFYKRCAEHTALRREPVLLNSCVCCSESISEKCDVSQQLLHSEYGLLTETLLYLIY